MEKNAKQILNEYCQREKLSPPSYTATAQQTTGPGVSYTCTLDVKGKHFESKQGEKTKKLAELVVAKMAVEALNIGGGNSSDASTEPKEAKKSKPNGDVNDDVMVTSDEKQPPIGSKKGNDNKPVVKEPSWISIEKVEDIYKHLSDEVLAQEFKSFLHCKAQEEKKPYPVFTVTDVKEPLAGFTCKVSYDGKVYDSLGLMNSKKQAEQSAAEVCLRTLGHFPQIKKNEYTIQVWKGGKLAAPRKVS